MELVIEIPDHIKEELDKLDEGCRCVDGWNIATAIMNGIPLPKGHGRLLDANTLVTCLEKDTREAFTKHQVWLMFSEYNEDVPTIIEADRENDNE